MNKLRSIRTVLLIIALLLPTIYVIAANYCGLNAIIKDLVKQNISPSDPDKDLHASLISVSTEYMVFAVLLGLLILLAYGINDLTDFSISTFFSGVIGILFTIDNLYPGGRFPLLQIPVPLTTTLAASVLNIMGYKTSVSTARDSFYGLLPSLSAWDPRNPSRRAGFGIAWPCAGVESLLIYTVTILLFLKKTDVPWKHRIIYFLIGAVVTYFINVFRVVTLFLLVMDYGWPSPQAQSFHDIYGMLYSITWIVSYPLIIIGSRIIWEKIRNWKTGIKDSTNFPTRTKLSE